MNQKEKLTEATILALQGKLTEEEGEKAQISKLAEQSNIPFEVLYGNFKKFADYLVKTFNFKPLENGFKQELRAKMLQNGYDKDMLDYVRLFDDDFKEFHNNYYIDNLRRAMGKIDYINYLKDVKQKVNDRNIYYRAVNYDRSYKFYIVTLSDKCLEWVNKPNPKQPKEKVDRTEEIYSEFLEEFDDSDLEMAYDNCNGTLQGFISEINSWYNGETTVIKNIMDGYDCDRSTANKVIRKVFNTIKGNTLNESVVPNEFDEYGLPKLEAPYYIQYDKNKDMAIIKSSQAYDYTDYSFATTKLSDILEAEDDVVWNVCDYNNQGKPYRVGIVEGTEKAVELMKELDSRKISNIDKN